MENNQKFSNQLLLFDRPNAAPPITWPACEVIRPVMDGKMMSILAKTFLAKQALSGPCCKSFQFWHV